MVHCRSDRLAWRLFWIVGRAVTTIVVSRRTIKVPIQVTTSVITLRERCVVLIIHSHFLWVSTCLVVSRHELTKQTVPSKGRKRVAIWLANNNNQFQAHLSLHFFPIALFLVISC